MLVFSALIVRGIVVVLRCGFRFREGSVGPFLVGLLAFFIIRSVVEGGLHLGFDFWIFAAIVYSAERLMLAGDERHGAATEGAPPAQPIPATQR
ncbi:MAG: hypothetical protein H5T84_06885 [Thermoleophilia bacterium]|nr:hypothetical protein [Thermoleophilia bacterium]